MKKNFIIIALLLLVSFTLTACQSKSIQNEDATKFKEEYESLNGIENSNGKIHRTVSINENNPFVYSSGEEIVSKIENKETFYVYFGSKLCPWCRSVVEKAIEVANKKGINTIYYVDIWDDEGTEILRDKYTLEDNTLTKIIDGTDSYYKLLEYLDNVLSDYTLTDSDGKTVETKEKRIYAPSFIYIENGKAVRLEEGISSKQNDSRGELTSDILEEEEELFNKFFE
jgi:thiol-disulfide isomerase/thioredoxin